MDTAFWAMADDGMGLCLAGKLPLDAWHANNAATYCTQADVSTGVHEIRVEYYEYAGNALIYVWYERR